MRESAGRLRFVEAGEADAIIHLIWIAPGSGVYGEMRRVIIDDLPRAFVYVTPAIDGQGPAIARLAARDPLLRDTIVYLTCVHELGHAVGLPHLPDPSLRQESESRRALARCRRRSHLRKPSPKHPPEHPVDSLDAERFRRCTQAHVPRGHGAGSLEA